MTDKIKGRVDESRNHRSTLEKTHAQRKRELDRVAQRASRERTKNRIRFLEEKLAALEAEDRDSRICDLMKVIKDLREENGRLASRLSKIKVWADVDTQLSEESPTGNTQLPAPLTPSRVLTPDSEDATGDAPLELVDGHEVKAAGYSQQVFQDLGSNEPDDPFPTTIDFNLENETQELKDLAWAFLSGPSSKPAVEAVAQASPFDSSETLCGLSNFIPSSIVWAPTPATPMMFPYSELPAEAKWSFGNEAYTYAIRSTRQMGFDCSLTELQSPLRAILSGWEVVDERQRSHPLWMALRHVDELILPNWSIAQKIAYMLIAYRLLLYRINPTKENLDRVPPFLRPRPSQERIEHPIVIDFFIWPGLRDRLVFNHDRYSRTGHFSAAYCSYVRFCWPFPDNYILARDTSNNYKVSQLFEKYAYDVNNWTVDERFFTSLPELRVDVPCSTETWSGNLLGAR
ncbi:uncharacterized protein PV07_02002 [Cladophialophora immunda]|uniref:BZIP domain-containing protein n=1 Tax=Cladophialophora immunda TaxID=569365 RepID=A0A0D2DHR1_9EURO|nr:uncharacterized protein PV07_02002 [Cladophialophora immunda]KIW35299.1 hypothetical protein PV07_02002 [Cladophialophora immunda]